MPNQIDRSEKKIQIEKRRLAKKSQKEIDFQNIEANYKHRQEIRNIDKKL